MRLTREFVESLVFGLVGTRRYTQDSPVLPDVWIRYGERPLERADLLITPHRDSTAGQLGTVLRSRLASRSGGEASGRDAHDICYTQGIVAASLDFEEVVLDLLPLTPWWQDQVRAEYESVSEALGRNTADVESRIVASLRETLAREDSLGAIGNVSGRRPASERPAPSVELLWYLRLVGVLGLTRELALAGADGSIDSWDRLREAVESDVSGERRNDLALAIVGWAIGSIERTQPAAAEERRLAWLVNLNRPVGVALTRSVLAIKADAALRLFDVRCAHLTWAVLDSGIDATHPAFRARDPTGQPYAAPFEQDANGEWLNRTRVVATYDFTRVRRLLSTSIGDSDDLPEPIGAVLARADDRGSRLQDTLRELRARLQRGREVDWTLLEPLLAVPHDDNYMGQPAGDHGTHVAGIIGADWRETVAGAAEEKPVLQGICPDIRLYDLRVLDRSGGGDEFATIAALQFIRHLNARRDYLVVHGTNLSLSIPHDVANFACGRTPVCEECERVASSGVCVVAAAGNQGYLRYRTHLGYKEGYHTISITDPGNAESVITVGATHRYLPHTYGVSYFSSRGPTGDGRNKPDLVAPGEKVRSCVPNGASDRMDGTSMAAPHVSGAAAMLMARHSELVGAPSRVKEILCRSATDLGRQPYFQGAGMLDVLRALQSV